LEWEELELFKKRDWGIAGFTFYYQFCCWFLVHIIYLLLEQLCWG